MESPPFQAWSYDQGSGKKGGQKRDCLLRDIRQEQENRIAETVSKKHIQTERISMTCVAHVYTPDTDGEMVEAWRETLESDDKPKLATVIMDRVLTLKSQQGGRVKLVLETARRR